MGELKIFINFINFYKFCILLHTFASLVQVWGLILPGDACDFFVFAPGFACEVGVLWGFSKFGRSKKSIPSLLSS